MIELIHIEQYYEQNQRDTDEYEMWMDSLPTYSINFFSTYIKDGRKVRPVPSRVQILIW